MKTIILLLAKIFIVATIMAQSPDAFQYQAVARDNNGEVISNQTVSFKISILRGSASGSSVYTETHSDTTNAYGLVTLKIGNGTRVNGMFSAIEWGANDFYIRVKMDKTGGTDYQLMGTSQLLSVPYAKYTDYAGSTEKAAKADSAYEAGVADHADEATNADTSEVAKSVVMQGEDGENYRVKIDSSGNLYAQQIKKGYV